MKKSFSRGLLKSISVCLVIVMIVQLLPTQSVAVSLSNRRLEREASAALIEVPQKNKVKQEENEANKGLVAISSEHASQSDEQASLIIGEDVSQRTENTKHFRCADGSLIAATYGFPVHYQKDGAWENIKNSLVPFFVSSTTKEELAGYEAVNGDISFQLPAQLERGQAVAITKGKHSVKLEYISTDDKKATSWGERAELQNQQKHSIQAITAEGIHKSVAEINQEIMNLPLASVATYKNVLPNTDFEYVVEPLRIKENIIVHKPQSEYRYTFLLDLGGLLPVQAANNSIALYQYKDDAEPVFILSAPYMIDANDETNHNISLRIADASSTDVLTGTKNKDLSSQQLLILEADSDWLNAKERAFPVTIDPSISIPYYGGDVGIQDTYVSGSMPNSNYWDEDILFVGRNLWGYRRAFIKLTMPQLPAGSMITNASFGLYQINHSKPVTGGSVAFNLYECDKDWNYKTVTWNNKPGSGDVIDYREFRGTNNIWYHWDITRLAKQWYNGGRNYGFMLQSSDESTWVRGRFNSANRSSSSGAPTFTVSYLDNKGLESYWSYSSFNVGDKGTLYVNDYTGNMTFIKPDVNTFGNRMPMSIGHVYNLSMKNTQFTKDNLKSGLGWKLTVQQSVLPSTQCGLTGEMASKYPYVYEDSDGTEHYFIKLNNNLYMDESGMAYTLSVPASSSTQHYKITDQKGNSMYFNTLGKLSEIHDTNGNIAIIEYKNNMPSRIIDGAGNSISLTTTTLNTGDTAVSKLLDPAQCYTQSEYHSNGKIKRIYNPDTSYLNFEYGSNNIVSVISDSNTDYRLNISYTTSVDNNYRVSRITEYAGTIPGQTITFDYSLHNTTIMRTSGKDGIHGSDDDIIITKQFDNFGRTVSVQTHCKDMLLDVQSYNYTAAKPQSNNGDIKQLNRVNQSSSSTQGASNLLLNGNFERTEHWTDFSHTGASQSISYTPYQSYYGARSMSISVSSASGNSISRVSQTIDWSNVPIEYTYDEENPVFYALSGYVKTENISGDYGAALSVIIGKSSEILKTLEGSGNEELEMFSEPVMETTDQEADNGWRRIFIPFYIPPMQNPLEDVFMVSAVIIGGTGTAYFDGLQLEKAYMPNNFNLLENSSFDFSTLKAWSTQALESGDTLTTTNTQNSTGAFQINGKSGAIKELWQEVSVRGTEEDTYTLGAWAKARAINRTYNDSYYKRFRLVPLVFYSDGTSAWKDSIWFNENVSEWQYVSGVFDLSDGNAGTQKTPTSIRVYVCYHSQANTAYFDNVSLIKSNAISYNYDNNGNLISNIANPQQQQSMEYDGANLISHTDASGNTTEYAYDSNNNLTKVKTGTGFEQNYEYNSFGQSTSLLLKNGTSGPRVLTTVEYDSNGLFLTSSTDENGNTVSYEYDTSNGLLTSVTDQNGNESAYEYDVNGKYLTKATKDSMSSEYEYQSGRLSKVKHNESEYQYTYDGFGNNIQTKVAGRIMQTNTFDTNNGNLSKVTFGNGDAYNYTYNDMGKVSIHWKNYAPPFSLLSLAMFAYDDSGRPLLSFDLNTGRVSFLSYDSQGRLSQESSGLGSTAYAYDNSNRLSKLSIFAKGEKFDSKYAYGQNNLPSSYINPSNQSTLYTYDGLNRISRILTNSATPIDRNYSYKASGRGADYTTTQLAREEMNHAGYEYEYDDVGNITQIKKRDSGGAYVTHIRYAYDALNRLIREDNLDLGKTIVYTYDKGNNITSKNIYNYTTGTPSGTPQTFSYAYDDSSWKDLLTSYNGQAITYDEIGNPLNYRGGMDMTWFGRELTSLTNSSTGLNISYRYDVNGLRTSKNVSGTSSSYYYTGGRLTYEKRGDHELFFAYDSFGSLNMIRHKHGENTFSYLVVCNSRGDVEALYNTNGSLLATYTYDSWGNILSIKDASGNPITDQNHIANLNPIRYRSYYYDAETGLYYLKSRYYDPVTARFINADAYMGEIGEADSHNLFAYCLNNPVMFLDSAGLFPEGFGKNVAYAMVLWGLAAAVENGLNGVTALSMAAAIVVAGQAQGVFTSIKVFSNNALSYGYFIFQLPGETFNVFTKKDRYGISKDGDDDFNKFRNTIDGFSRKYADLFVGTINLYIHFHHDVKEYYDSTHFPSLYEETGNILQQSFFGARNEIINRWKNLVKRYGIQ